MNVSLIILSAGSSSRFLESNKSLEVKKQWIRIGHQPLWLYVANRFKDFYKFDKILITVTEDELNYMEGFSDDFDFVVGGDTRQQSLQNAVNLVDSDYIMVTDVARCCVTQTLILDLINNIKQNDCIVPYLNVSDTVVYQNDSINRDEVKLIQTPQLSKTNILKKAIAQEMIFTDDSSAIKNINGKVVYIKGTQEANKLTIFDNLKDINCLKAPSKDFFVGNGFDVHSFQKGKKMVLGGVELNTTYGFKAHSDGDVLIHALIDSILGAIGHSDIGELFPDNDNRYKGISSVLLLKNVVNFARKVGFELVNTDITVMAEKPKLKNYKRDIKFNLSKILDVKPQFVNIKATTTEKLGFIGRAEGVGVNCTTQMKYFDWTKI
jgi:2-C-methyl-D-erythritol 4-phosphate cytidylyltransferase/2-C-methyl-D-erythritol 2,4-cyclodiphosphate synthase